MRNASYTPFVWNNEGYSSIKFPFGWYSTDAFRAVCCSFHKIHWGVWGAGVWEDLHCGMVSVRPGKQDANICSAPFHIGWEGFNKKCVWYVKSHCLTSLLRNISFTTSGSVTSSTPSTCQQIYITLNLLSICCSKKSLPLANTWKTPNIFTLFLKA